MAFPRAFSEAFRGKRAGLVERIDVSHGLLNELLDREVLTTQQIAHCKSMLSEHERVNKMLELLEKRDDQLFPAFCMSLTACDQPHIIKEFFLLTDDDVRREEEYKAKTATQQQNAAAFAQGGVSGRRKTGPFMQPVPKLDPDQLPKDVLTIPYTDLTDLKALAEGGFGVVYRATHADWGTVAYKQLKTTIINKTDKIARELVKEAQMHVLRHPNIVAMLAVTFEVNHYGVVFEFISFGGLDGFVGTYEVSWWMKLTISNGIVCGLNYLHTKDPPVIHGDLKAQNVLIDNGFIPKICDFGLSKWRQYSTTRTMSSSQRGTVTHIPPENWQNINQRRTTKYDIYGFGIMLWEILSEEPPFMNAQANVGLIQTAVVAGQRPDLESINRTEGDGTIDDATHRFAVDCIQKCWHQDMNMRPSFAELNKQFEEFLQPHEAEVKLARADLNVQVTGNSDDFVPVAATGDNAVPAATGVGIAAVDDAAPVAAGDVTMNGTEPMDQNF